MRYDRDYDERWDDYDDRREPYHHRDRRPPMPPRRRPVVHSVQPKPSGKASGTLKFFVGVAVFLGLTGAGMGGYSLFKTLRGRHHDEHDRQEMRYDHTRTRHGRRHGRHHKQNHEQSTSVEEVVNKKVDEFPRDWEQFAGFVYSLEE